MSGVEIQRLELIIIVTLIFVAGVCAGNSRLEKRTIKSYSVMSPVMILYFILFWIPILAAGGNRVLLKQELFGLWLELFFHASIYYGILLLLMPLIRKKIRPLGCATLWLLPGILLLRWFINVYQPMPVWVWVFRKRTADLLLILWGVGAASVFGFYLGKHVQNRRFLLNAAAEPSDHAAELWLKTQQSMQPIRERPRELKEYRLMVSEAAKTPVTVGLIRRTMVVVLPKKEYTDEQLTLIFKHELTHILRHDTKSKLFMICCTALCWFNPLVWPAMRSCAEDLELSCDEQVLMYEDDKTRKNYAELLLSTAADSTGITSCLSGNAAALKDRLTEIIRPGKKVLGSVLIGLAVFALLATSGLVAIAWDAEDTAQVEAVRNIGKEGYEVDLSAFTDVKADPDQEGIHKAVSELGFLQLTGSYEFWMSKQDYLHILYHSPEGLRVLYLWEHYAETALVDSPGRYRYYIEEPVDLEQIRGMLNMRYLE